MRIFFSDVQIIRIMPMSINLQSTENIKKPLFNLDWLKKRDEILIIFSVLFVYYNLR